MLHSIGFKKIFLNCHTRLLIILMLRICQTVYYLPKRPNRPRQSSKIILQYTYLKRIFRYDRVSKHVFYYNCGYLNEILNRYIKLCPLILFFPGLICFFLECRGRKESFCRIEAINMSHATIVSHEY